MSQNPNSYERLTAARTIRPLCWNRDMPHLFKHEGIWRVSLVPKPPRKSLSNRGKSVVSQRWVAAYHWLGRMEKEGRLP